MYIMVLNESKHFSSLDGCRILHAPDDMMAEEIGAELLRGVTEDSRLTPIRRFAAVPTDGDIGLGFRNEGTAGI